MHRTEVFICFQSQLIADAIQCFINGTDKLLITGRARLGNLNERLQDVLARADVIVVESDNTNDNLFTHLQHLQRINPNAPLLLLSEISDQHDIRGLLSSGIRGFLVKSCTSKDMFLEVIERIQHKMTYYCSSVTEKLLKEYKDGTTDKPDSILTDREFEILTCLAKEMNTYDIADQLYLSPSTVKTHRRNIMRKLEASSLLALLRRSVELGLITHEELVLCKACAIPGKFTETSCVQCD